jgi:hypothetical protein
MTRSLSFQRIVVAAALVVGAVVVPVATSSTPVSAACTWCAGGEYHALTPARILDTRPATSINDVAPLGAKPLATTANTFTIDLLGLGGVPSVQGDVLAVAASITVVNPTRSGFLGAYAAGSPSVNSVINFAANQNVPNLTILRPGNNGDVTITITGSGVGSAHVLVDVFGWWSTSAYDGRYGTGRRRTTSAALASSRRPRQAASSTLVRARTCGRTPIGRCRSVAPTPSVPTPSPTSCPTAPTWWAC